MTTLSLPYPPSANRLWRNVPGKGTLKSGHYRLWLTEALATLRAQRAPTLMGPYRLTISAVRPDNRKRDLDNIAKPISDALKDAGVIEGDHLAKSILLMWSDAQPVKGGAITVHLEAA
jgi:Holliday junction resolvase RusA-like endonuclease